MNPYKVLGIDNSASDDEIKKAYRKLSKENHPDVNGGDDTRFKEINQAYKILTDPKERAHHEEQQFKRAGFSDPFGGFWSQSSMDEAFKNFYEGPFGPYKTNIKRKTHGTDIIVRLKITLEESFFGKPIEIKVDRSERLNTEKLVRRSRRIKVNIPRGAKNNQNLVLRGQGNQGINGGSDGDMVIQIGVKPHPHFIRKDHDLIAKLRCCLRLVY
jgi:DnaJ-class molecular chaperone